MGAGAAAIGVGAAMAAAGTAAAIRAARLKAQPRKTYYGGSQEEQINRQDSAKAGLATSQGLIDQGQGYTKQGLQQAGIVGDQGNRLVGLGEQYGNYGTARMFTGADAEDRSLARLEAAAEGKGPSVGEAVLARQASLAAQQAQALASTARGGNQAAAMRNATAAGVAGQGAAAQEAAILRNQEAANARYQAAELAGQIRGSGQTEQQLGLGAQELGMAGRQYLADATGRAGEFTTKIGADREATYLGNQTDIDQGIQEAQLDYDRRRQAERQRRSDRIWGFAGALTGGGANVLGGALGGK